MTSKLVVGPLERGLKTDRTAFVIDNDSFPTLINAYQWRGRVKRKRGTSLLTRLRRYFDSTNVSYSSTATITLNGSGIGNILTGFGLQSTGNIIPGTVTITAGGNTYTDPAMDGTLSPSGTIVYSTGVVTILAEANNAISVIFSYYPGLPVLGLEDFIRDSNQYPGTIAFDQTYSYNIITAFPYSAYDVSFYKNPATATYPGYTRKTNSTPTTWNGENYQQFWSVNYQGALWVTNGVDVPFTTNNIGMQFKPITGVVIDTAGNGSTVPAVATITVVAHGLSEGDFVFINEVGGITGINFQTGYVTDDVDANTIEVTFPIAILGGAYTTGGIAQYLTNRSNPNVDCIRYYDGDPTDGNIVSPTLDGTHGWVNFMPPLSQAPYSIAGLPPAIYYLVGAKLIASFKDRLVFFGPVVQTSTGVPKYLKDTAIFSDNASVYYTASFSGNDPRVPTNIPLGILVPDDQTGNPSAFLEDSTGFGGFVKAGLDETITTASSNEDALIVGFSSSQTRFVFTGNDIVPFDFYLINNELGSSSTFSSINMDRGVITRGSRGYIITSQTEARRIDLDNPDQVFQIRLTDNGAERLCSQRDYINEWIYFTYPSNQSSSSRYIYPTQTFQYNYRDESWAIYNECYTTYGAFRKQTGFTWQTVGLVYPTWQSWNAPWNAGSSTLLQPEVIGGNQQGFVITRDDGTNESVSLFIQSFAGNIVTSPDHCLNNGDFIQITGALGTISAEVNGRIFSVQNVTRNTFELNPSIVGTGTYFGGGLIKRMYVPFIQTKQFPLAWQDARKTRLGVQRYLLTKTQNSQITLLIFLSQDNEGPLNSGPIIPESNVVNSSLVYSTILYTCPESTNLGLTPANINLQTPTATSQQQIWHRMNTSLLGDTVQVGFTLSDSQMRSMDGYGEAAIITGVTLGNPTIITANNNFNAAQMVIIQGIIGTEELNSNTYFVITADATTITLDVDSTAFTVYEEGGTIQAVAPINQFAEIELHGFIMDVTPSQMLV